MATRFNGKAALLFTAMVLAGCSLVESVIVVEPVKAARPSKAALKTASLGPEAACGPRCQERLLSAKASSARYDSGPVLKPIKKSPEKKTGEDEARDSIFMKAVKSWFRTGMQLHTWVR